MKKLVEFNVKDLSTGDGGFLDELLKVKAMNSLIVIGIMTLSDKPIYDLHSEC